MRTPVLAANTPSYREVCGDAALFFEVDDINGLATCLRRLLADPQLASAYVGRGSRRVSELDSTSGAEHMLRALESLV